MRTFDEYLELAKQRNNIISNNKLASAMNITGYSIHAFRYGKALPADETMLKIAALAGVEPEEALMDLSLWRSANNPEVLSVWKRAAKMIKPAAFSALLIAQITATPHKASAGSFVNNYDGILYIMSTHMKCFMAALWRKLALFLGFLYSAAAILFPSSEQKQKHHRSNENDKRYKGYEIQRAIYREFYGVANRICPLLHSLA